MFEVNVFGPLWLVLSALPVIRARRRPDRERDIGERHRADRFGGLYSASKTVSVFHPDLAWSGPSVTGWKTLSANDEPSYVLGVELTRTSS